MRRVPARRFSRSAFPQSADRLVSRGRATGSRAFFLRAVGVTALAGDSGSIRSIGSVFSLRLAGSVLAPCRSFRKVGPPSTVDLTSQFPMPTSPRFSLMPHWAIRRELRFIPYVAWRFSGQAVRADAHLAEERGIRSRRGRLPDAWRCREYSYPQVRAFEVSRTCGVRGVGDDRSRPCRSLRPGRPARLRGLSHHSLLSATTGRLALMAL